MIQWQIHFLTVPCHKLCCKMLHSTQTLFEAPDTFKRWLALIPAIYINIYIRTRAVTVWDLFLLRWRSNKYCGLAVNRTTVCLDIAKWNHFFMKPNNLTSLRRMSRVRLAWRGFLRSKLTISQSKLNVLQGQRIHTLLHHYSARSLIDSLSVLSEGRYAHAGNKIHDTGALVRASSAWAIRGNKAQICCSERTSGTGYC